MEAEAAATLQRLEALSCPVVRVGVPLEPPDALRLLCTPSPLRLALLEWACCRLHPHLAARLQSLCYGPADARLRELAKVGETLMLCRADEMALVEGTAPPGKQLEFLRDLLDAAPPAGEGEEAAHRRRCSVVSSTGSFLQNLLRTPEGLETLTPPAPPPLPSFQGHGSPSPPRSPPPPLPELEQRLEAVSRRLELLELQNPELGGSPPPSPPLLPTLGAVGRDMATLATAFGASELGDPRTLPAWGAPPTPPHPCGSLHPPVLRGLRQLVQCLEAVTQLQDMAVQVTRVGGGARHQAMETRVGALQRRFTTPHPPPKPPPCEEAPQK